jgi:hypothetical protein
MFKYFLAWFAVLCARQLHDVSDTFRVWRSAANHHQHADDHDHHSSNNYANDIGIGHERFYKRCCHDNGKQCNVRVECCEYHFDVAVDDDVIAIDNAIFNDASVNLISRHRSNRM